MKGSDYLLHFCAAATIYFHLTTAYDLLRYSGRRHRQA